MKGCCLLKDSRNSSTPAASEDAVPPNTSTLDVFSTKDITGDAPDFAEKVLPFAMSVELGPGDLLSFPPGWWHGMRSESTSFSVSMWFWSFLVIIHLEIPYVLPQVFTTTGLFAQPLTWAELWAFPAFLNSPAHAIGSEAIAITSVNLPLSLESHIQLQAF